MLPPDTVRPVIHGPAEGIYLSLVRCQQYPVMNRGTAALAIDSSATRSIQQGSEGADALIPGVYPRNGFKFRRGQEIFLGKLAGALQRGEDNHLGVFVPGYGKTITALASFVVAHSLGIAKKLVVFV